jgi:hypothetical protein
VVISRDRCRLSADEDSLREAARQFVDDVRSDLIMEYLCYLTERGAEEAEPATPGAFSGMTSEGRCEGELDLIEGAFC